MFLENFTDAFIREGIFRIFFTDALFDERLNALRTHLASVIQFQRAVEEELEFVHAKGGCHILIGRDAADRGFVHVDIVGDVFQDKRLELADPFLKKAALMFYNTFDNFVQCPLPLVQAFDKPRRGTDFFVEVFFFLAGRVFRCIIIHRAQVQIRQSVLIEDNKEFSVHLVYKDIRADISGHTFAKTRSRHGIKGLDDIQVFLEFIHIQPELAEQGLVSVGLQILKVIAHEIDKDLIPVIS